jgi:WD40 repeat protein
MTILEVLMSAGTKLSLDPYLLMNKNYQLETTHMFGDHLVDPPPQLNLKEVQEMPGNKAVCSVDFNPTKDLLTLGSKPGKRYRYLPFLPNFCTYLKLDAQASLVITGPISGCHIFVGGPADTPILMHCNWNKNPNPTVNSPQKLAMATTVLNHFYPNSAVTNTLTYNKYQGNLSFVIGCRPGSAGPWRFYVYGFSADGQMLKRF